MEDTGLWVGAETRFTDDFVAPPLFTRLSDPYFFEMYHRTSVNTRACHGRDFAQNGEARPQRLPAGRPVIAYAFGIPFVAVFNGTSLLGGEAQNWSCPQAYGK